MYVAVRENNVDQALRVLKKKMQREGMFREMNPTQNVIDLYCHAIVCAPNQTRLNIERALFVLLPLR